ncbi:MAG: hypothetical protein FJ044_04085 [Candidatus Cloacimonetes bacterium]|nr:hypothetical protein [Candidatus Cloacimonadota bacterium]
MTKKIAGIFNLAFDRLDLLLLPVLALILLLPKFPLFGVEGTYVNIRLEDFVVAALFGFWGLGVLLKKYDITRVFAWRPILGFLLYGFVITLLGIYVFKTVEVPHLGLIHFIRRIEYTLMYFVAGTVLKKEKLRDYVYFLLTIAAFTIIYGYFQWKDILPGVQTLSQSGKIGTYTDLNFVISTFAAHYDFGAFLMLMMPITLAAFFSSEAPRARPSAALAKGGKNWVKKGALLFLAFAIWWMAKLVYARAAYLSLIAATTMFLVLKKNLFALLPVFEIVQTFDRYFAGRFSKYTYQFSFKVMPQPAQKAQITESASGRPTPEVIKKIEEIKPTSMPSSFNQKLDTWVNLGSEKLRHVFGRINLNLDPSGNIRLQVWQDVLAQTYYHFLWGGGYYSIGPGADNDYVRAIAEVGVIGLSIFLLILKDFALLMWRNFRKSQDIFLKNFSLAVLCGLAGLLINAVFIDIFEASKIAFLFWFLMGIISKSEIRNSKLQTNSKS